ncbi:DUF4440 domain-containing protein [Rhizobium laguerreae]|uniref:nuclear transport factor 2 family protein n=1 Tax=Rhizobium laguerreae TaxID=1076926 RepID=UPI001C90FB76|nr:DUF4440 domain-containing protein [Rhizobium laguerreae]MBY3255984.1 DUF4440 domain-containing protein [Rhizobium laguerreae]MBY3284898.1 DUF4440 domain-containing protein [Rhizobium laguerreae]MBY3290869.1 DUF4440 domain-containing protein [Rhizobium laguerreae]MBY3328111.1 DUF4440 domain-containing protein [Rhizobium laguerreae]MBY3394337.1 DUF4440 domain-containing protein [Rhizobium laguerreae]
MDDLAAHLKELEEKLFDPSVRASREMLTTLLSRDFREIGSSGRLYTFGVILPSLLAEQRTGTSHGEHFETQRLAEHIALVTYRAIYTDTDGSERRTLRSSIWRLEEDGHWRMLFHQGTVIG